MAASIARMRLVADQDEFIRENRVFHDIVSKSGHNDVLESFWSAISLLASGEQHGITYSFGNRMHVVEAHEEILRACRAREPRWQQREWRHMSANWSIWCGGDTDRCWMSRRG
jgi:GntR family transcriptional repressor for pyruvate dehydrogenase complex